MNWFESLEQKSKLMVGGIVTICVAMLAVSARRNNVSFDSYWHLQAGLDWINKEMSPWLDHFSFTFYGEAIAGPPYMFQALLGWIVNSLGIETGFQLFLFVIFILILGLVTLFLRILRAPVLIYCLVLPLIVVLLQFRAMVRPELITYGLCVIAVMLYHRSHSLVSRPTMLPILALMLFWTNYHSSIFGYIIFFGLFVDAGLSRLLNKAPVSSWLKWLGWGLAIIGVGFLNPEGSHPLIRVLTFPPEWKQLIQEYQSPLLYRGVAATYALLTVTIITLGLLLWRRAYGLLVISCILVYFSLEMARLVAPGGIIILCIFAWVASEALISLESKRIPQKISLSIAVAALLVVVMSVGSGLNLARDFMKENLTSEAIFPGDVVDYMIDTGVSGRIFNEYQVGGYLAHRLAPDSRVYVDGRTGILYPLQHYKTYLQARNSADALRVEMERFDIQLVLLKNDHEIYTLTQRTGLLGLDFAGEHFSLFKRDNPNFPALGRLMAQPSCWSPALAEAIKTERSVALWLTPQNSALMPMVDFAVRYSESEDQRQFLENLEKENTWNDFTLRFAGFQAIRYELYRVGFDLFAGIQKKTLQDYLAAAWAKSRLNEWRTAEELLDLATRTGWKDLQQSELVVLIALTNSIKREAQLKLIEEAYLEQLFSQLDPEFADRATHPLSLSSFCPVSVSTPVQSVG